MSDDIKSKLEAAVSALKDARDRRDEFETKGEEVPAEHIEVIDRALEDVTRLEDEAEIERKNRVMNEVIARYEAEPVDRPKLLPSVEDHPEVPVTETEEYAKAFKSYVRGAGVSSILRKGWQTETKVDGTEGTGSAGGFLVPKLIADRLWEDIGQFVPMLQLVTPLPISGYQVDVSAALTHGTPALVAEGGTYTTVDETYSQVTITTYKYTALTKISEELLADAKFPIEAHISSIFARRLGEVINGHLTTGTGTAQPKGIVTAVAAGQTVTAATGNTTTVPSNDIFETLDKVKAQYWPAGVWQANQTLLKVLRQIKDSQNRYMWEQSLQIGQPSTLIGFPVYTNPDVASPAASAKSLLFANLDGYVVVEPADLLTYLRLNELYAATGQVGFRAHMRRGADYVGATDAIAVFKHSAT